MKKRIAVICCNFGKSGFFDYNASTYWEPNGLTYLNYMPAASLTQPNFSYKLRTKAPAKIILSGEHAVVYGAPALAMAVNRFATTSIGLTKAATNLAFNFPNLNYQSALLLAELQNLRERLHNKYNQFLAGEITIRDVLSRSFDLLLYAFGYFVNRLNLELPPGLTIDTRANIPIGCGMGSSAATIISALHALNSFFASNVSSTGCLDLAKDVESLQHGKSSGVDLYLALHGGAVHFTKSNISKRELPTMPFCLVNTGRPVTTTGECVSFAKKSFTNDKLLQQFVAVTEALDLALANNDLTIIKEAIAANEKLLEQIGVVPKRVQQFIWQVKQLGGVAKICGGGACAGDNAGVVLIVHDDLEEVTKLAKQFGYEVLDVQGEEYGARIAS